MLNARYSASVINDSVFDSSSEHSIDAGPYSCQGRDSGALVRGTLVFAITRLPADICMPTRFIHCCAILMLSGCLLASAIADTTRPLTRPTSKIALQPPRLALLARHLIQADISVQWDFASITLDVLLETYRRELLDAATDKASTQARRAKLARWQRATQSLIDQLDASRARLLEDAPFSLLVDPQQQVLIVIDGQPIAVTAPRAESERAIGQRVIEQFCAYNDCSILGAEDTGAGGSQPRPGSVWVLRQHALPAVEVDGILRCEFKDTSQRERKAQLCGRLAAELAGLADAIEQARIAGYRIDWEQIANGVPRGGGDVQLVVNDSGAYVPLSLPMLSQLDKQSWHDLVSSLDPHTRKPDEPPVIRRLERLMKAP